MTPLFHAAGAAFIAFWLYFLGRRWLQPGAALLLAAMSTAIILCLFQIL
jgi:hypothetical protein